MAYGWEGELVRLVPVDEAKHLDNALRWMNDPEVTKWLLVGDFPLTRLAEAEYLRERSRMNRDDILFAVETLSDECHVGFSGVHQINYQHGTAITGTILGPDYWGIGFGTDAAKIRARYAFEVLGLRMLMSAYFVGNEGSWRMQEKAGYVECGRIPQRMWKRGAYRDEVLTYLMRERWLELQAGENR